jgi:hypothetical protein
MVGDDSYRKASSLKVVFPFLQGMDDSQEFLVIDIIVSFSRREGFQQIHTGV